MPAQSDTLAAHCPSTRSDQTHGRAPGIEGVLGTFGKLSMHALFTERSAWPLCAASASSGRKRFEVMQCSWPLDVLECPTGEIMYKRHVPHRELMNISYPSDYIHFRGVKSTAGDIANSQRVKRLGKVRGRLLDYGCGEGSYDRSATNAGWDAHGSDPSLPHALKDIDGPSMFSSLDARDDSILQLGKFDVISLCALAERLEQLKAVFENLSRMLPANGRIVFNSPNGSSLVSRLDGRCLGMAVLVGHLQFHTPRIIRFLARELGLKVTSLRYCGSLYPLCKRSIWNQGVLDALLSEDARGRVMAPEQGSAAPKLAQQGDRKLDRSGQTQRPLGELPSNGGARHATGNHLETILTRNGTAA